MVHQRMPTPGSDCVFRDGVPADLIEISIDDDDNDFREDLAYPPPPYTYYRPSRLFDAERVTTDRLASSSSHQPPASRRTVLLTINSSSSSSCVTWQRRACGWLGKPNGWALLLSMLAFSLGLALSRQTLQTTTVQAVSRPTEPSGLPQCFQNTTELRAAVGRYIADRSRHSAVAQQYGWPINNWCVGNLTDFSDLFAYRVHFDEEIADWDVSNGRNFSRMFINAGSFQGDLSSWNVSQALDMSSMFRFATSFRGDLSHWDVSRVQTMWNMFTGASAFNSDISHWNLSSVTNLRFAFSRASSFRQNLCAWGPQIRASNVSVDVLNMFRGTQCPVAQDTPTMTALPPGPFCFSCGNATVAP